MTVKQGTLGITTNKQGEQRTGVWVICLGVAVGSPLALSVSLKSLVEVLGEGKLWGQDADWTQTERRVREGKKRHTDTSFCPHTSKTWLTWFW